MDGIVNGEGRDMVREREYWVTKLIRERREGILRREGVMRDF